MTRRGSTKISNKHLRDLLPGVLEGIANKRGDRPDLILSAWSLVVGEQWSSMTQAVSFEKGAIMVKVKNAALYSLLVQQEKERLLKELQNKFPNVKITNIIFRIG